MTSPLLLALDQGTQSARAMLFDARGELVARVQQPIEAYFSDQPGQAEQHADYFCQQLSAACQTLWAEQPTLRERIVAVALTTQRASVVCLDQQRRPLRPAVIWLDQRRGDDVPRLPWYWRCASSRPRRSATGWPPGSRAPGREPVISCCCRAI